MFISNVSKIAHKIYRCNSELGNKLIKLGVPLLGRIDDDLVFANTKKLKEALKKIQEEK
jgi:hypothetical protein